MPITSIVGLDTAKNVFQLHGVDLNGRVTLKKAASSSAVN